MEQIDNFYKTLMSASIVIGLVAWFIRLESKTVQTKNDLKNLEIEIDIRFKDQKTEAKEKEMAIWSKIDKLQTDTQIVLQTLSRIEESLRHIKKDQ